MQLQQKGQNPTLQGLQDDQTTQALKERVSATWHRLTEEEIACFETNRPLFYEAVQKKYNQPQSEVEEQIKQWKRELRDAA